MADDSPLFSFVGPPRLSYPERLDLISLWSLTQILCWLEINCRRRRSLFASHAFISLEVSLITEHRDEKLQAIILKVSKIFRRRIFLLFEFSSGKRESCAHTQFTWGDPANINLDNNLLCSCFVSELVHDERKEKETSDLSSRILSSSRSRPVS